MTFSSSLPASAAAGGSFLLGKALIRALSPLGNQGLSVFIYHRVLPQKDPLFPSEVDRVEFDEQIRMIKSMFRIIPLRDAIRDVRAGMLPSSSACITFDDGYADNAEVALPVLQQHSACATFFVATGFLNGGRMWNDTIIEIVRRIPAGVMDLDSIGLGHYTITSIADRQQTISALIGKLKYLPFAERMARIEMLLALFNIELPNDLMMTSAQVNKLKDAGMEIGAHTVNHPILSKLPAAEARFEIAEGKLQLEAIIGAPVSLFAYPNGKPGSDYLAEHVAMAKEIGFEGAVSTAWGANRNNEDLYQIPRFTPWDRTRLRFAIRMARNRSMKAERV